MSRGENTRKRIRELLGYADDGFLREDEVEGLTKCFGDFTAVDHISFSVNKGEIFGFLGANGAGKTTAMKMLCGLSKPTEGRAVVAGYDLHFNSDVKRLKKVIAAAAARPYGAEEPDGAGPAAGMEAEAGIFRGNIP